jgi:hypothetical protein
MTINPPPTWTTGSEIPKKDRMSVPMKYDPTSKKKLFTAIRKDSALRVVGEYSLVIARKIGLPPSGSTIGNRALRIRNRLFAASTKMFLQAAPEPWGSGPTILHGHRSGDRSILGEKLLVGKIGPFEN